MLGPCVKQTVTATILTDGGDRFVGTVPQAAAEFLRAFMEHERIEALL